MSDTLPDVTLTQKEFGEYDGEDVSCNILTITECEDTLTENCRFDHKHLVFSLKHNLPRFEIFLYHNDWNGFRSLTITSPTPVRLVGVCFPSRGVEKFVIGQNVQLIASSWSSLAHSESRESTVMDIQFLGDIPDWIQEDYEHGCAVQHSIITVNGK